MEWISVQNLIGGMALGFEDIFGKPKAIITNGIANDKQYIAYCEKRNLNVPVINANETFTEFDQEIPYADIYVMTPFCSGLSKLNISSIEDKKSGNPDNCQNQNMYSLLSLALRQKPKMIVFENAPALYNKHGSDVFNRISKMAIDCGYSVQLYKTNTLYHGIPQSRSRTFAIFYRDTNPAVFAFERAPYKSFDTYLNEDLGDLQTIQFREMSPAMQLLHEFSKTGNPYDLMSEITDSTNESEYSLIYKHGPEKYIKRLREMIENSDDKKLKNKCECSIRCIKKFKEKIDEGKGPFDTYPKLFKNYARGIISKNIRILHPNGNRFLNMREMMHLMALPNDFELQGGKRNILMITQNVPVCTARFIAKNCKDYFDGKLEISATNILRQSNITHEIDSI